MNKFLSLKDLDDCVFFTSLSENFRKSIDKKIADNKFIVDDSTILEEYQDDIMEIVLRIYTLVELLGVSRILISERSNLDSNSKIKDGVFFRYNIEAYYLRITSLKDLIFKLINRVYQYNIVENLGLESKIKKKIVVENNEDLSKFMAFFSSFIETIAPLRNNVAHGGYHWDKYLTLIESRGIIRKRKMSKNDPVYKAFSNNALFEMYMHEHMIVGIVLYLYTILYPIRISKEKEIQGSY
jgi:hypothetical protein